MKISKLKLLLSCFSSYFSTYVLTYSPTCISTLLSLRLSALCCIVLITAITTKPQSLAAETDIEIAIALQVSQM